jgi:hypothetical protein
VGVGGGFAVSFEQLPFEFVNESQQAKGASSSFTPVANRLACAILSRNA